MPARTKSVNRDEDGLPKFKTGEEFDALGPEKKEKVWAYCDRLIPSSELRDPTPEEAATIARQRRHNRKAGRPKVGKGAKMAAVTIELGLRRLREETWDETSRDGCQGIAERHGRAVTHDRPVCSL